MHIVNAMFGRGLGGIEQSFLDYTEALVRAGHSVTAIVHPKSLICKPLQKLDGNIRIEKVSNWGQWDIWAVKYIEELLREVKPDAIIAHGNRAISLLRGAANGTPIIGPAHNYKLKRHTKLDAVFAPTDDLKKHLLELGIPKHKIYHIPNMIRIKDEKEITTIPFRNPPVIGSMGRFVKKKGFADFIHALLLLKSTAIPFRAVIGGEGEELDTLRTLVSALDLEEEVRFVGWVDNKKAFFDAIDIFCLPSLHEPFGIVLLEAFLHRKPVVTTDSEGPHEIAKHNENALIVPVGDHNAMAEALKKLINDEALAHKLANRSIETVKSHYDMNVVSQMIDHALQEITA